MKSSAGKLVVKRLRFPCGSGSIQNSDPDPVAACRFPTPVTQLASRCLLSQHCHSRICKFGEFTNSVTQCAAEFLLVRNQRHSHKECPSHTQFTRDFGLRLCCLVRQVTRKKSILDHSSDRLHVGSEITLLIAKITYCICLSNNEVPLQT